MKIERLIGGNLESNGYIVYDSGEGIIIDPGYNPERYIKRINDLEIKVKGIYLTHHHYDHVGGVLKLKNTLDIPVYIHRLEGDMYKEDAIYFDDKYKLKLGKEEIIAINTKGHTRGGVVYMCPRLKVAFTGDTIFNVDLGRTDLESGSQRDMEETIQYIISKWSNEVKIYPGHGDPCTMKYVRENNWEFKEIMEKKKEIKLIALDLDGTTLNGEGKLTSRNKEALHRAMEMGVHVVIATGRCFSALPDVIKEIDDIEYAITSNGGLVSRIKDKKIIFENPISRSAIPSIISTLKKLPHMIEVFSKGEAYVNEKDYMEIKNGGVTYRHRDYVLSTRKPIKDVFSFMEENSNTIENINIFFDKGEDRHKVKAVLDTIKNVTITSSLDNNWEIGGKTTSKADALKKLSKILEIKKEEILACGDSPNDGEMLKLAGIPIAVLNAKPEVKKLAKYITDSNDDDGVGKAIEKFVL